MREDGVPVKVPTEFWTLSALPEGYIERWLAADGARVEAGSPVALIRVEDTLQKLVAPATGTLTIGCPANSVVDPGMSVARITPQLDA